MSSPSKPAPHAGAAAADRHAREAPGLDVAITNKRFVSVDGMDIVAIDEIAFACPQGGFTALIGPSGCGKTTTLRIILGLDRDFSGHVRFRPGDGRMAAVFQEPRLLPWRDVETNVRLALPASLRDADLGPLFTRLGLAEMRTRFPSELSLGLARRAALARAFATEPSLLLLDEPFVSLDEMTAAGLRQLLVETWSTRPTTALMVTHNLREAVELADAIVFLTPRPARIRGRFEIATPRPARTPLWREAIVAEIDALYPGVL